MLFVLPAMESGRETASQKQFERKHIMCYLQSYQGKRMKIIYIRFFTRLVAQFGIISHG